jgi:ribosomal protein S8
MEEVIGVKNKAYEMFDKVKEIIQLDEIVIDLETELLEGNVLDVGVDNKGIVYQMCKSSEDELSVDYIEKDKDEKYKNEGFYDTAVLFFTINKFNFIHKKKLLGEIYEYLKEEGEIKIWDVDKNNRTPARVNLKVLLPGKKEKKLRIRDFNIVKDSSKESIIKLLAVKFDIIEMRTTNNIYYIKGRKKKEG